MNRKLLKSVREYKKQAFLAPVLVALEVLIEVLIPLLMANIIDIGIMEGDMGYIIRMGLLLVFLAVLALLFGAKAGQTAAVAAAGYAKNLRHDIFYKIQEFSFKNIDHFSTPSLVTRLTTDITNVQMAFMFSIRMLARAPIMVVLSWIMTATISLKIAFLMLITIPILGGVLIFIAKKAHPHFIQVFDEYDILNNTVQENVNAARVVKAYVREDYEKKKFDRAAEDVQKDFTKAERILAINNPLMQFCIYVVMIFVMSFGSYTVITSQGLDLDVGQMSSLLTYSFQILMSLMMVSMIFVMVTMSLESAERIVEVLSEESTLQNPQNPVMEVKDGSIDFDQVSFKYSKKATRNALSHIDLHIKSGEIIGILGGTGSSKTSLIQLIPRLYDATEGTVKVGGVDVRDYDLETLRNQVAVVLQKNELFSGTIKENLRWGNPNATDEQLEEACRLSQADEFIQQFPQKYDTYIEQGGTNVSGGQKQRLCIARALLKKPKILILDDSTSAVDTRTDALIRQGFRKFIPETTKIIIAQRVASVQDADRIILMNNGEIDAIGSHEELMATNQVYREIYTSQNRTNSQGKAGAENG